MRSENCHNRPKTGAVVYAAAIFALSLVLTVRADISLKLSGHEWPKDDASLHAIPLAGDGAWTATTQADWIDLRSKSTTSSDRSRVTGTKASGLFYKINAKNYSTDKKTATVDFDNGLQFTVTQRGYAAELDTASPVTVPAAGCGDLKVSFDIEEDPDGTAIYWTAASGVAWITVSPQSGHRDGEVLCRIDKNTTQVERSGTVTIAGKTLEIRQLPAATEVQKPLFIPSEKILPSQMKEYDGMVRVTAGKEVSWTVENDNDWIDIYAGGSGCGDGTLSIKLFENKSVNARTGIVYVGDSALKIVQKGTTDYCLKTIPATTNLSYGTAKATIDVIASKDLNWVFASHNPTWLKPAAGTGVGNGKVSYTVGLNDTTEPRTGVLEFTAKVPLPEIEIARGLTQWRGENQATGYPFDSPSLRDPAVSGDTEGVWFVITNNMNALHRLFDLNGGAATLYVRTDNRLVLDDASDKIIDLGFPIEQNKMYDIFLVSSDGGTDIYGGLHDAGTYRKLYASTDVLKITNYGRVTKPSEEYLIWGDCSKSAYYHWTRALTSTEMMQIPLTRPKIELPTDGVYSNLYSFAPMDRQFVMTRDGIETPMAIGNIAYGESRHLLAQGALCGTEFDPLVEVISVGGYYETDAPMWRIGSSIGMSSLLKNYCGYVVMPNIECVGSASYSVWLRLDSPTVGNVDLFEAMRVAPFAQKTIYDHDGDKYTYLKSMKVYKSPGAGLYKLQFSEKGFRFIEGGVASPYFGGDRISFGRWQMLTVTSDGSKMTLYLDGEGIGNVALSGYTQFALDAWVAHGNDGLVAFDDVKFFDACLLADQVREIHQLEKPLTFRHVVRQEAAKPQWSEAGRTVPCTSGSYGVGLQIAYRVNWTATTDAAWITLSKTNGVGSAVISFEVAKNTETYERRAEIVVAGVSYWVVQEGTGVRLEGTVYRIRDDGSDSVEIPVQAADEDVHWVAEIGDDADWLFFKDWDEWTYDGFGSSPLVMEAGDGLSAAESRMGRISVAGNDVYVFQRNFEPELSPSAASYYCVSTTGVVRITVPDGQGLWSAVAVADWIHIECDPDSNYLTRSGNDEIPYSLDPNLTSMDRVGQIIVAGETCVITQKAKGVLQAITVEGPSEVFVGDVPHYGVRASYSSGWQEMVSPVWEVQGGDGASVDVTGALQPGTSAGKEALTAVYSEGGISKRASIELTVSRPLQSLAIIGGGARVAVGEKISLSFVMTCSDGNSEQVTPTTVSVEGDATIDASGNFSAGMTEGTVTVTASYSFGGVSKTGIWTTEVSALTLTDAAGGKMTCTSDAVGGWSVVGSPAHDDAFALRSGKIDVGQTSVVRTTIDGGGELSCWMRLSTSFEKSVARCEVVVDDVVVATLVGVTDWTNVVHTVETWGAHVIEWRYVKDLDSDELNDDAVWLDEISWTATPVRLATLVISGPDKLNVGDRKRYSCQAKYNDGTMKSVNPSWRISQGFENASVEPASGWVTATQKGTAYLRAAYYDMEEDVTLSESKQIEIDNEFSHLIIKGPDEVCGGGTGSYACYAVYSDGTEVLAQEVEWSLSEGGAYAEISAKGVLVAGAVDGEVTVKAVCMCDGNVVQATFSVRIFEAAPIWGMGGVTAFKNDYGLDWTLDTEVKHDGNESLTSGSFPVGGVSGYSVTVSGSGTVACWMKASLVNYGFSEYKMTVDGTSVACFDSGNTDWTKVVYRIDGGGDHVIKWYYNVKSQAGAGGRVWLDTVTWTPDVAAALASVSIVGDYGVVDGGSIVFGCKATYEDGSSKTVAPTWSITSGSTYATIDSQTGLMTATGVGTVVVCASYTAGGVTKTATRTVTVRKALKGVSISGATELYAGDSRAYACTATYSDGSETVVACVWTLTAGSERAVLDSSGSLTAGNVSGEVAIKASYTYEGTTKSATKNVEIKTQVGVASSETGGKAIEVPLSWVNKHSAFRSKFGSDLSVAMTKTTGKKDGAGNPLNVWHDYVAGTDPTDEKDVFRAKVEMVDGLPHVSWEPNMNESAETRTYKVYGRRSLSGADAWEYPANSAVHQYFKVDVAMPDDNDGGSDAPGEVGSWLSAVIPTAVSGLVYDGTAKQGVLPGIGYQLLNASATGAGSYVATAALASGYRWANGSQMDQSIPWAIAKANNAWKSTPSMSTTTFLAGTAVTVVDGVPKYGSVTRNYSDNAIRSLSAGSYTLTSTVSGTANYAGLAHSISFTVTNLATQVALPTAKTGLAYTGSSQTGVSSGTGYTITGNSAVNAGSYTATVTLKSGYAWKDGSTLQTRTIAWSIAKATNSWLTEPSLSSTEFAEGTTVTISMGAVKFGVRQANYTATELAGLSAGSYALVVSVAGTDNYTGLTMSIPFVVTEVSRAVTGMSITPTYLVVNGIGKTNQLVANVLPATAEDKLVTWSSGDTSVATVDKGMVTATGLGNTTITGVTHEGGFSKSCSVTVASDCIASGADLDISNVKLYSGSSYPKSGNGAWIVQGSQVYDGTFGLRSGNRINRSYDTYAGTIVYGSGTISFWWKVSTSTSGKLRFYVEGDYKSEISGTGRGWEYVSIRIDGSECRRVRWVYNASDAQTGDDCGWVDCIRWVPDATSTNPPTQIVITGSESMTSQERKTYSGKVYRQSGSYSTLSTFNEVMFGTCEILPIWSLDESDTLATIDPYTGELSANGAVGAITVRATYLENGVMVSATKMVVIND